MTRLITAAIAGMAIRKTRPLVAGSKGAARTSTRLTERRIGRTSSIRVRAKGLGCIRPPTLTIKGSPTCSRSRASA
ncbi:hypothetical protein [Tabrizicola sp.]|uniref:hypothetical protein n=1 Tax=Tabrizicola sp. TaxID=2005166 RepID=UPI00286A73A4|nr:hypothetical protein [Tabrizicola sp.]